MVWKGVLRVLKGVLSVFEKNKQRYEISHPPSPAPVYEKNHKKSLILRRMASLMIVYFAAMSVPYMLAFPAFGSLVSSVPPIMVSMAGYILVFAAFLLV